MSELSKAIREALLFGQPATVAELAGRIPGGNRRSIGTYMKAFRRAGLVRVVRRVPGRAPLPASEWAIRAGRRDDPAWTTTTAWSVWPAPSRSKQVKKQGRRRDIT